MRTYTDYARGTIDVESTARGTIDVESTLRLEGNGRFSYSEHWTDPAGGFWKGAEGTWRQFGMPLLPVIGGAYRGREVDLATGDESGAHLAEQGRLFRKLSGPPGP